MKIVSFGPKRSERPGVYVPGKGVAPLDTLLRSAGLVALDTNAVLALLDQLVPIIEAGLQAPDVDWINPATTRLGPPVPFPEKIIVAGGNYQSHVDEAAGMKNAPSPSEPIIIFKPSNTVIGPTDDLVVPRQTEQFDYETEIGVVIGRGGRYISVDDAYDHVAGYVIANDVTARDLAFKDVHLNAMFAQMTRAKGIPTGAPLGPWLVTKDEIPDPHDLTLRCWVNGELRQEGNSDEMIVDIPHLIEDFSKVIELSPGDVIMTGTTTGCGAFQSPPVYLRGGDVVRMEISGLGVMETPVVEELR
ncbi:fumarylacetoacetate hydrolase family protein [Gordonia sp. TBRC 11910]|uniref:Fumarylacetoacetate hydrolase family protein n=1 Tax=Gordonia asplenii TaxID=2725283 RepID=A0A848KY24_9ACTN|nr:fumarylacetoacetate hydrolase family protein [Gordonia asplenii]NMO03560.1 fumarylacetoacetate hydrolase family protein [Gordonia asplenii]